MKIIGKMLKVKIKRKKKSLVTIIFAALSPILQVLEGTVLIYRKVCNQISSVLVNTHHSSVPRA